MKKIHILGGGTFSHVRTHLALATPAFGTTAKELALLFGTSPLAKEYQVVLHLTKMADPESNLVTNDDVAKLVDELVADPETKMIVFNVALTDFVGQVGAVESGKYAERLHSREAQSTGLNMQLTMAEKILSRIRKERKDIFLIAFKTTAGADKKEQYLAGLNLLKENSCNLVLANDVVTHRNIVIVPEEAYYGDTLCTRREVLALLTSVALMRSNLTYTRSTVVPGDGIDWNTNPNIPDSLRKVVNHCIQKGAYKPFRGATAGHFAVRTDENIFITSRRKSNFNELDKVGMIICEAVGEDKIIAYGGKPSVGGQSQRIVFKEHPGYDCIVHFHCPTKVGAKLPRRQQIYFECGSHECGKNTSNGLKEVAPGIKVVHLDNHGPNIVFNRNIDPNAVIKYIDETFELSYKTGGLV